MGQQHPEDFCHPGQQLDGGREVKMQHRLLAEGFRRKKTACVHIGEQNCLFQSFRASLALKNQLHLITCKAVKTWVTKALQKGKVFNDFHCFHSFSLRFPSLPVSNPHGSVSLCCLCSHPKPLVYDLLWLFLFLNLFQSEKGKEELAVQRHQLGCEPPEHKAGHRLLEPEWPRGAEIAARLEHHQRHAACWLEMELLQQQLQASQEKVGVLVLVAGCSVVSVMLGLPCLGLCWTPSPEKKKKKLSSSSL